MKKITTWACLLVVLFLVACTTSPASTPTPLPSCDGNVCIRNVYLEIVEKTLLIHFDLVDQNYEVNFGESLELQSKITFALFLDKGAEEDTYLAGMSPSLDLCNCYSGNDFPWSEGQLASACGLAFPLSILQVKLEQGDSVRVEVIDFDFDRHAIWLPSE